MGVKCLSCNRALPTATTHTNAHGTATTVSSGAAWYPGTGSSSKRTATSKGDRSASLEPLLMHEHTILASDGGSNSGNSSSSAHAQLLALHHKSRGQTQVTVTPSKLQAGEVLIGSSSADGLPYGFDTTDNTSTATTGSATARTQSLVFAKSGVTSSMIPVTAASSSRGIRGSALETRGEGRKQVARHHSLTSTSTTSTGSLLPTLDDFDNGQQSVAAAASGSSTTSSNVTIVSKYSNRLTPLSPQKPAPAAHKLYTVSSCSSNSSS
jgi:hypothetical protein